MDKQKLTVFFLAILTLIAVGAALKLAASVVIPLMIAWLLSYMLGPVTTTLVRRRIPTPIVIAIEVLLLVGVCYLVAVFLYGRVGAFAKAYPRYQQQLVDLIRSTGDRIDLPYNPLVEMEWGQQVGGFVVSLSGSVFSFMSNLLLVMFFLVFLLMGKPFVEYKVRHAFTAERGDHLMSITKTIGRQIGRYLAIQFLISLSTGFCVYAALRIIKVDFAVTWGALAFFLNFIPTVGSIIASVPPVLLAIVQFYPSPWPAVATAIALLGIQMTIGNVISPKVMGDRLNLSPVVVLLSLVFWGWLWGIVGAILSVPIAAAIKIVCDNIEPLRPVAVMMGSGRVYSRKRLDSQP